MMIYYQEKLGRKLLLTSTQSFKAFHTSKCIDIWFLWNNKNPSCRPLAHWLSTFTTTSSSSNYTTTTTIPTIQPFCFVAPLSPSSSTPSYFHASSPIPFVRRWSSHDHQPTKSHEAILDSSSSSSNSDDIIATSTATASTSTPAHNNHATPSSNIPQDITMLVYQGPFASLALRLKRISITTALASIMGIPMLLAVGSSIPASGQLAVGGTAILAATGSTAALSFCFSPYIETLEWIPVRQCRRSTAAENGEVQGNDNNNNNNKNKADAECYDSHGDSTSENDHGQPCHQQENHHQTKCQKLLLKATTRNVFAIKVETVFDPEIDDIVHNPKTYRPFCNFMVKGRPFFVHPELIQDDRLRALLLGGSKEKGMDEMYHQQQRQQGHDEIMMKKNKKKKDPDDDFI